MNRLAVACSLSLLALAVPGLSRADELRQLSADEVERLLGKPDVHVFDVNEAKLYAETHVPGAIHAAGRPLEHLLPPNKEARLIFYCTNPK